MKKKLIVFCIAVGLSLTLAAPSFAAMTLNLNGDELFTGGTYTTAFGDIDFVGEIITPDSVWVDPEMVAAPALSTGNVFDVTAKDQWASLTFKFGEYIVTDITFVYGGNADRIIIEALDDSAAVIGSLSLDAPTGNAPAGPVTWYAGAGNSIYSLRWKDPGGNNDLLKYDYAALDNITLTIIPAPGAILLGSIGVGFVGWLRRRRTL